MDKILRPQRLDIDLGDKGEDVAETFNHWKQTLENYMSVLDTNAADTEPKKYMILCNYVSAPIYTTIKSETEYTAAVGILKDLFVRGFPLKKFFCAHS